MTAKPFVEAARAMGASRWQRVRRHVLPQLIDPIAASGALLLAVEAGLSYRAGCPPSQGELGQRATGRAALQAVGVVADGGAVRAADRDRAQCCGDRGPARAAFMRVAFRGTEYLSRWGRISCPDAVREKRQ